MNFVTKIRKRLKLQQLFLAVMVVLLLCTTSQAQPAKKASSTSINADYVNSLSRANLFLVAWKERNVEKGLTLISPELKRKMSEEDLKTYLSGTPNPSDAAFEVNSGKRQPDGRYAFEVKSYEYLYSTPPESQSWKCPKSTKIVLVKVGNVESPTIKMGNWLVDELPANCELIAR